MKKIFHLLKSNEFSGAEKVAVTIINTTTDYKHYYVSPKGSISKVLDKYKINFLELNKFNLFNVFFLVKDYRPDIIHAHDISASLIAGFIKIFFPKTIVISHLHSNDPRMKKISFRMIFYSSFSILFSKIIVVSDAVTEEFAIKRIMNNSVVLKNIVDADEINKLSEIPLVQNYDIVFVGRLTEIKNPLKCIDMIFEIKKKNEQCKAVFVGRGPLFDKMNYKIKELNLTENIFLVGFDENPYKYIKNSKCLLLLSRYEGFGLVVLESLLLGTPVVASNVGGIPEILDNSCGLVSNKDEEILEELSKLISDESYLASKKNNALIKANKINDVIQFKKILVGVYGE